MCRAVGSLKTGSPVSCRSFRAQPSNIQVPNRWPGFFDLEESGYFYTRLANPTNDAVAAKIAELEGGVAAILTSSGRAANFYAVFNICQSGDHFVCSSAIYGGTFNLLP